MAKTSKPKKEQLKKVTAKRAKKHGASKLSKSKSKGHADITQAKRVRTGESLDQSRAVERIGKAERYIHEPPSITDAQREVLTSGVCQASCRIF